MEPTDENRPTPHEEIRQLLPWMANDTLAAEERGRVEEHLAGCPACREDLAGELRLAETLRKSAPVAPVPHSTQLARLFERIDRGSGAATDAEAPGTPRRRERTPLLRWLLIGQAAAILVLAAIALAPRLSRAPNPTFHTLSAAPAGPAMQRLRVVFADDLDQRGLREILLPLGAEIVAGPSPLGVYTLALRGEAEPLDWVVAHLRSLPAVRFAEPLRSASEP